MQGATMTTFLPVIPTEGSHWLDVAACADLSIDDFFVAAGHVIDEEVLNTCRRCPVRIDCLQHAYNPVLNVTGGYFAGMSPGQRRELDLDAAIEYCRTDTVEQPRKVAPMTDEIAPLVDDEDDDPIIYR
jgi:hypothetical protein